MTIITCGIFAGMDSAVLQSQLQAAQQALIDLQSGAKSVTLSYTQGDGSKSIGKRLTSPAECTALIQQLQQALGIRCRPRRSLRFIR